MKTFYIANIEKDNTFSCTTCGCESFSEDLLNDSLFRCTKCAGLYSKEYFYKL